MPSKNTLFAVAGLALCLHAGAARAQVAYTSFGGPGDGASTSNSSTVIGEQHFEMGPMILTFGPQFMAYQFTSTLEAAGALATVRVAAGGSANNSGAYPMVFGLYQGASMNSATL